MSSALAAASLILKPEGYSEGTLESLKPIDRSGDFTFTRGSNLSATRINSAGLIEKGRENLLLQSNQFDTTWLTANTSLTGGQSGYDGSSDAWLLDIVSGTNSQRIEQSISQSGVQTYSVYVKKGTLNWVRIRVNATVTAQSYFDLENGVVGTIQAGLISRSIESVGNGWFRCSIVFNSTSSLVRIYPANDDGSVTQSSGSIYIQDAQLEAGLAATDYIETAASTVKAGILENTPRLDYSGGVTEPSLLLEPSRTNLIGYSEYLSGLSLFNSPTITQNYAVSPEGVQNAVRIQDTDAANFKIMQTQFSVTAGSTYTISVYVKKATSPITTYGAFYFDFDGGTRKISDLIFDEYNGTLVNALGNNITSVIHPVIDEGDYWRFSATATDTGSNTLLRATLRAGASANGTSLSLVTKDYTAYGFQCEQGSYPTSYIPNHSGGSVTREVDDIARINNASTNGLLNNYNTTFLFEGSTFKKQQSSNTRFVTLLDAAIASNPRILLFTSNLTSTHSLLLQYRVSGETDVTLATGSTFSYGDNFKAAVTISGTSLSLFVDGVKIGEETIVQGDDIEVIDLAGLATDMSHNAKQFVIFPTALSDADCITLTTL